MIKRILLGFMGWFFVIFCCDLAVAANLQRNIDQVLKKYSGDIDVGVEVRSLNSGQILYQHNAKRWYTPASTVKIFTAAAALAYLGPDYQFRTQVIADSQNFKNGVLYGNVYFSFSGDPSLKHSDLEEMVGELAKMGIKQIHGDVYIDDFIFDQANYGPGWLWDDQNFCYAAPIGGVIIDRNCFPFKLTASARANSPAALTIGDEYRFMPIENSVMSRSSSGDCPLILRASENNQYYLSGCIRPDARTIGLQVAVKNIRLYAQNIVDQLLKQQGIRVTGEITFKSTPDFQQPIILAHHDSLPLTRLVTRMLRKSDNLIADSLYKKIGYTYWHQTATWKRSSQAIASILSKRTGIDFTQLRMVDGSGLSRYNLISPTQMVQLLRYAYRDDKIRNAFFTALPVAGISGTLKWRMSKLAGRVMAKTGNMKGISSLAGYVTTSRNSKVVFAILSDDFLKKPNRYHQMQDDICRAIAFGVITN